MLNKKGKKNKTFVVILSVLCVLLLGVSVILIVEVVNQKHKSVPASSSLKIQDKKGDKGTPYKVSTAKIGSAGDLLIHSPILRSAKTSSGEYDFNNIFECVKGTINDCDYFIANLEVTLGGDSKEYTGYPTFNCPDSIVDAAKNAGIDCLLTANNHSYDTGKNGFIRTQNVIDQKGLDRTGSRLSESNKRYLIKEVNGISFGFICYTYETVVQQAGRKALNGILMTEDTQNLINSFDYNNLDAFYSEISGQFSQMKADGAEVLTVYIHWGDEYKITENAWQNRIAQKLCDLGVDVIIGGHPHVVEPMELITSTNGEHKTVCIYSVGNFVSNQRRERMNLKTGHTEDGVIFTMTFSKYSDGTVKFEDIKVIPIWVHLYGQGDNKVYSIVPLDDNISSKVSALNLNKTSDGVSMAEASYARTNKIIEEGYKDCLAFIKGEKAETETLANAA